MKLSAKLLSKCRWAEWVIVAFFLVLSWILFQLFGPNPQLIVSKETTVITAPLREDGVPDYQKYWRDLGREGVTHENNGAVLFWQAIWSGELSREDELPMSDALGFDRVPSSSDTLQQPQSTVVRDTLGFWLKKRYQAETSNTESNSLPNPENQGQIIGPSAEEIIDLAATRPWTSEQVPPLADWVVRNKKPLDLLVVATERPKWWSPSPSTLRDHYEGGFAILLPDIQSTRAAARSLSIRAMWHAGEGRKQEAWSDLKACYRLARVTGEGPTLVGQLVAIALDGVALQRTLQLLQADQTDATFARQILDELRALKTPSNVARSLDEGERLLFVDSVLMMMLDENYRNDFGNVTQALSYLCRFRTNWNKPLYDGNSWYDRLVEAARKPIGPERTAALQKFEDDLDSLAKAANTPNRVVASFLSMEARSRTISDVMIMMMLPALGAATNAEDRAIVMLDLAHIAAALAVYRAEQGEYPDKLAQLVPGVLASLPDDLYSGKPFIYERKSDDGYLLYSVFENGIDDDGTDHSGEIVGGEWLKEKTPDVDYQASDMVIRMPMPKFEFPSTPEFVE